MLFLKTKNKKEEREEQEKDNDEDEDEDDEKTRRIHTKENAGRTATTQRPHSEARRSIDVA